MKAVTIQLNNLDSVVYITNKARSILNRNVKDKNQRIECVFQNAKSARTIKQNKLIHAIFNDISVNSTHVGEGAYYSPQAWKEYLKDMFLDPQYSECMGKVTETRKSTAKLTRKECGAFVDAIVRFCSEREIELNLTLEDYDFLTR